MSIAVLAATQPSPASKIYPYRAARPRDHAAHQRVGDGHQPTSQWRAALSISPWCSIGSAAACCHGGCRSPWRRRSASTRWRMLLARYGKPDIFNTTRAVSSPALPSPAPDQERESPSAWTAKAPGATTSSSSGLWRSPSNTRRCICGRYDSVGDARASIGRYLDFYNGPAPTFEALTA